MKIFGCIKVEVRYSTNIPHYQSLLSETQKYRIIIYYKSLKGTEHNKCHGKYLLYKYTNILNSWLWKVAQMYVAQGNNNTGLCQGDQTYYLSPIFWWYSTGCDMALCRVLNENVVWGCKVLLLAYAIWSDFGEWHGVEVKIVVKIIPFVIKIH